MEDLHGISDAISKTINWQNAAGGQSIGRMRRAAACGLSPAVRKCVLEYKGAIETIIGRCFAPILCPDAIIDLDELFPNR